ncbi:bifunctional class I SAM-dependent methyltransferase/glycosyltransferase family 2 protein [Polynucleobacter ibericus]|uniref:bifunctional class I SAM-dependent methyltransferase/glycosyltransferase family 2 protein n=1 Tax=Polynucleobacter ibericus TaxID=1819725 RepID=UPI001BFE05D0|nr:bifunctional class I SAM-dependent methyltransferase/glycosyltransferase family 2 protein [Polynucleobacter ibericus]QWE08975.1 glycosyltransferase [Polynucleobacter ibericus]
MNTHHQEFIQYQQKRQSFWQRIHLAVSRSLGGYYQGRLIDIYQQLIPVGSRVLELGCANGRLLAALDPSYALGMDFSSSALESAKKKSPQITFIEMDAHEIKLGDQTFDFIILSDLVNDLWDVQTVLEQLRPYCHSETRIIFNFFSHLWSLPLRFARWLGLATPNLPQNWLTRHDMKNLLEISEYEVLREWREIIAPLPIPLLSNFCNRYLARIWPFELLDITNFVMARPIGLAIKKSPTVSVIVAARNESGHIEELMERIPEMGGGTEIIFVEGNSTDDTYDKIALEISKNPNRNCKLLKQDGKGKGNAVRNGFDLASGDILMILDADITVPPEDLMRFFNVIANGSAEFVNGVRLVYPMQEDAMRFLNLIGNKFFSWAFSWLLGQPIRDTLCGTKVLWNSDYKRIAHNRSYFGDFDPFGDFDLLFGAARLNLKIMEVPIRYRARRYGETNISRWSHGWLLLKMVVFAARRIKFT